jgi:large subunit ribosomal protein L2
MNCQMPVGTIVHNVEMKPGRRARSSVPPAPRVVGPRSWHGRPPELREQLHPQRLRARLAVSNPDNQNQNFAKAGRTRWKGKRPLTRGVAKNPVDHPHGGGEGRTWAAVTRSPWASRPGCLHCSNKARTR